jgi:hypothetical protein
MTGPTQGGDLTVVAIPEGRCVLSTEQVAAVAGRRPPMPRFGSLSEGASHH